jgi:hypothetical protein
MSARSISIPRIAGWLLLAALSVCAVPGFAPLPPDTVARPFAPGERFVYRVSAGRLGRVGQGTMQVQGPETLRDREVYLLSFSVRTRIGFVTATDTTRSWLDPARMESLRFYKHERNPLAKEVGEVEIFPGERRWRAADGETGSSPCGDPLDELSFIYFIRTLPLRPGDSHSFDRHFHAGRNPVEVQVLRADTLTVPAGTFPTVVVEMRVRDPKHYGGEGIIRLWLSDDAAHVPVRIESSVPVLGRVVLSLEGSTVVGLQSTVVGLQSADDR